MRASEQDGSYPRPQLVRADWTCLDGTWEFGFDDEDRGRLEHWYRARSLPLSIEVPFVFESSASGIGDHDLHPVVWYRRSIDRSCTRGRREILHFGAVDQAADVWVDGQHVGFHRGGQTAFSFDITDALAPGTHHTITVRGFDDPNDGEVPRGKQDWRPDPHFIWYRRSTGIWQTVWLESVPEQHLRTVDWSCAATVHGRGPQGRRVQLDDRSTRPRRLPVMITEFGGVACAADGTWGYAVVSDDEQFRDRLTALFDAVRSSPKLSGFCYTQLTGTLQESNGLLTADRRPKLPIELLRAIVTGADQPAK